MTIRFDSPRVGENLDVLQRHATAFQVTADFLSGLVGYGVQDQCDEATSKIDELNSVTAATIEYLSDLRIQIHTADQLSPAIGGALRAAAAASQVELIRAVLSSQLDDLGIDDVAGWMAQNPEWLSSLSVLSSQTTAVAAADFADDLDPTSLRAWWADASADLRNEVIARFPGLVGKVLRAGGELTPTELEALNGLVVYSTSSTEQFVGLEGNIPITKIDLGTSGELALAIETLSDGTALVHVLGELSIGAGASFDDEAATQVGPDKGLDGSFDVAAAIGAGGVATFRFDDLDSAVQAIENIKDSAAATAVSGLANALPDWTLLGGGIDKVFDLTGVETATDILEEAGDRLETIEVEVSVQGSGSGNLSGSGSLTDFALNAGLGVKATGTWSEQIDGDSEDYLAAEIEITGELDLTVDKPWFIPIQGPLVDVHPAGSLAVEVRRYRDGREFIVIDASYSTSGSTDDGVNTKAVTIDVPINGQTRAIVEDAVRDLADGKNPLDSLSELNEHAQIEVRTVTVYDDTSSVGFGGNNLLTGERRTETGSIVRRQPGGDWYAPDEVQLELDRHRQPIGLG